MTTHAFERGFLSNVWEPRSRSLRNTPIGVCEALATTAPIPVVPPGPEMFGSPAALNAETDEVPAGGYPLGPLA